MNYNYLNLVNMDSSESKNFYLKIIRVEMVSDCEKSESYSFSKCVENYVIRVKEHQYNFFYFIHLSLGCWLQSNVDEGI